MFFGEFYNKGQKVLPAEKKEGQNWQGQVWISGYDFAHDINSLQKNNIKAVCSGVDLSFKYPEHIKHLKFDLDDYQGQKVDHTFDPAFQFIESHRKNTNVLVHCAAGISRCSMILISYMMKKYKLDFDTCLKKIRAARPCCQPNTGFQKQLRQYQKTLGIQ